MLFKALRFAHIAHAGQRRKYGGAPFVTHPIRVCSRVMMLPGATEEMCVAALLHDTVEDCAVNFETIEDEFGPVVRGLVEGLTNPSKQHPELPRAERKEMDREHAAEAPLEVKAIKVIDRIDNLGEMDGAPDKFLAKYLGESKALAGAIGEVGHGLQQELLDLIVALDNALFERAGRAPWANQ